MKIIYISIILYASLFFLHADAQSLNPHVLASSGGYFTSRGNSLSWTLGETMTTTLSSSPNKLSQGFQQPEVDVRAGSILMNPLCIGLPLSIPYYATGFIGSNNTFIAQLSDAGGDFSNPVYIGHTSGSTSGTIDVIIPPTTQAGSGYRIRILSTLPSFTTTAPTVLVTEMCSITLNLHLFIEGYYLGNNQMQPVLMNSGMSTDSSVCDSITVNLYNLRAPYNMFATDTVLLSTAGNAQLIYPSSMYASSLWLAVKNRTTVETWSKIPVTFGLFTNYSFATP